MQNMNREITERHAANCAINVLVVLEYSNFNVKLNGACRCVCQPMLELYMCLPNQDLWINILEQGTASAPPAVLYICSKWTEKPCLIQCSEPGRHHPGRSTEMSLLRTQTTEISHFCSFCFRYISQKKETNIDYMLAQLWNFFIYILWSHRQNY